MTSFPEWIIWLAYLSLLLTFGGICITVYELLMEAVRCM